MKLGLTPEVCISKSVHHTNIRSINVLLFWIELELEECPIRLCCIVTKHLDSKRFLECFLISLLTWKSFPKPPFCVAWWSWRLKMRCQILHKYIKYNYTFIGNCLKTNLKTTLPKRTKSFSDTHYSFLLVLFWCNMSLTC